MFDADRVRVELCQTIVLQIGGREPGLQSTQAAELWLSDAEGKIRSRPKPDLTITGSSRSELLRQIAAWIDQEDDNDLAKLVARRKG